MNGSSTYLQFQGRSPQVGSQNVLFSCAIVATLSHRKYPPGDPTDGRSLPLWRLSADVITFNSLVDGSRGALWRHVSKPRGPVYQSPLEQVLPVFNGPSRNLKGSCKGISSQNMALQYSTPDVAAEVLGRDEAESVAAKPGANLRGSRHCCRMVSRSQPAGDNQCSYGLPDTS